MQTRFFIWMNITTMNPVKVKVQVKKKKAKKTCLYLTTSIEGASMTNRRNDTLLESSGLQGGDQKQRRKEQNRAAQRAFRERKERYVKELQLKIRDMDKKHHENMARVTQENESLKALVKKMEAEIYTLKGAAIAFDVSLSKLREAGLDVPSSKPIIRRDSPPPSILDRKPSPDQDYYSTSSALTSSTERRSVYDPLFDSLHRYSSPSKHQSSSIDTTDDDHTIEDEEEVSFAERETKRFDHAVDPIVHSGLKMIPYSQIWERLSQHPNFDEFDVDKLCEELKKKAKCSGSGPVIPESELQEVLRRMDAKRMA
ncbi:transcription factor PAP1-domain-containing protein [Gilbertella persicaria]|uniref:transcription factor PAP1-domain-containing protein n=1 Tax=Gilbertella persicaria TaxID=101096 RepID=UPI00221FE0DC|nr:transcription factor PAP1-domain-containing protein [Gilbertella persicaria]KAI8065363.1 transcription factor PAP1-domain-containing protein [Gilbertella persicaria]